MVTAWFVGVIRAAACFAGCSITSIEGSSGLYASLPLRDFDDSFVPDIETKQDMNTRNPILLFAVVATLDYPI